MKLFGQIIRTLVNVAALSIWFGVHESGWRLTLIVFSYALGAVAIIGCGFWLLKSASLPKKEGE